MKYRLITEPVVGTIKVEKNSIIDEILEESPEFNLLHNREQIPFGLRLHYDHESVNFTHSRYGHSLGVSWIAYNFAKHLEVNGPDKYGLTALLHDVGYIKLYYHHLENYTGEHEDIGKKIIKENFGEIIEKYGYKPKENIRLIDSEIVKWSDRFDYVKRDAKFSVQHASRWDSIVDGTWLKDKRIHLIDNDNNNPHIYNLHKLFQVRAELAEKWYHSDISRCLGSLFKKALDKVSFNYNQYDESSSLESHLLRSSDEFIQDVYWRIFHCKQYPLILRIDRENAKASGLLELVKDKRKKYEFEDEVFKRTKIHIVVDSILKMRPWEIFPILTEDGNTISLEEFDPCTSMWIKISNEKIENLNDFRIYGEKQPGELKTVCKELLSSFTEP